MVLNPDGHPLVAALMDPIMAPLDEVRARLIPRARGRVLEIGMGTGLNLQHYAPGTDVVGVEPDPHMRRRAVQRVPQQGVRFEVIDASAEALPFPDGSFDTVVATWVLCTIPDPDAAAAEMHRVLAMDGQLIFAEHTIAPCAITAGLQSAITPIWRRFAGGCCLDRDAVGILERAGFALEVRAPKNQCLTPTPVYRGRGLRLSGSASARGA